MSVEPTDPLVELDYELIARQLLRAIRGPRSQVAFSRRLGYRSNMVYLWESGRAFPPAARFLSMATRLQLDVDGAVAHFYGRRPSWLQ